VVVSSDIVIDMKVSVFSPSRVMFEQKLKVGREGYFYIFLMNESSFNTTYFYGLFEAYM
jgi:hypothetical protein